MTPVAGAGAPAPTFGTDGADNYAKYLQRKHEYLDARRAGRSQADLSAEREEAERRTLLEKTNQLAQELIKELGADMATLSGLTEEALKEFSLADTGRQIEDWTPLLEGLRKGIAEKKESLEAKEAYCDEKEQHLMRLIALLDAVTEASKKAKQASAEKYLKTPGLSARADAAGRWGASQAKNK